MKQVNVPSQTGFLICFALLTLKTSCFRMDLFLKFLTFHDQMCIPGYLCRCISMMHIFYPLQSKIASCPHMLWVITCSSNNPAYLWLCWCIFEEHMKCLQDMLHSHSNCSKTQTSYSRYPQLYGSWTTHS